MRKTIEQRIPSWVLALTWAASNFCFAELSAMTNAELEQLTAAEGLNVDLSIRLAADDGGNFTSNSLSALIYDSDGFAQSSTWNDPAYIRVNDVFGALDADTITLDSSTDTTSGVSFMRVGLPNIQVHYFQVGGISIEQNSASSSGPEVGRISAQGDFNMSGSLNLWSR